MNTRHPHQRPKSLAKAALLSAFATGALLLMNGGARAQDEPPRAPPTQPDDSAMEKDTATKSDADVMPAEKANTAPTPSGTAPSGTATSPTSPTSPTTPGMDIASADWPANILFLKTEKGKKISASGSLSRGEKTTLALPTSCMSQSEKDRFQGNHVLFATSLPARTNATITLRPREDKQVLGIYAYAVPSSRYDMPSKATSVSSCKASVPTKLGEKLGLADHARTLRLNGNDEATNVIIGVAGVGENAMSDFDLTIEIK